jgi:CheY-like chemotaxis protein/HPt (histidine-containing phosphotransfer) domain-containing protein
VKAARTKYKVLVAEDNPVNKKVVIKILEDAGFIADAVVNGLEAVQAVSADQKKYNLILMDVQMPEMDGFTATQQIRLLSQQTAKMPIIALTAHATSSDREKCLAAGMSDYLTKPIKNNELISMLDKWLEVDYSVALATQEEVSAHSSSPSSVRPAQRAQEPVQELRPVAPQQPENAPVKTAEPIQRNIFHEVKAKNPVVQPVVPETPAAPSDLPLETVVQTPVSATPAVVDIPAIFDIEHFKSVSLDDAEFKDDLLSTYVDDTLKRITQLRNHIAAGNLPAVISESHTIKGASYSVGAKAMGDQAKALEFAGKGNELANLPPLFEELKKRYAEIASVKDQLLAL